LLVGLLVLLPSTWLPRWAATGLAGVLIAASLALGGDRLLWWPGCSCSVSVLVRFGIVDRIEESTRVPLLLGLALGTAAAPLVWAQVDTDLSGRLSGMVVNAAGILLAGVYVCALLVLLRAPLRPVLATVFAPLGRMALTNYLTATVIVTAASLASGDALQHLTSGEVIAIAAAVLCAQWLWSVLWLRRFRYGPLEWLWRWATWARRPTLRR
jgi:uncharacterized protein